MVRFLSMIRSEADIYRKPIENLWQKNSCASCVIMVDLAMQQKHEHNRAREREEHEVFLR